MQIWLAALTGGRAAPDYQATAGWANVTILKFNAKKVKVQFKNRIFSVSYRYVREGKCVQCGFWITGRRAVEMGERFCGDICEDASDVRVGMRETPV